MDDERTTIAGHPLVRLLRRDGDREAWVAVGEDGAGVELQRGTGDGAAVLAREAEAVAAAAHPHLVPILDVAADGGAVLVRPLLQRDLAGWLVARGAPEPGEAVTALAPVAAALGALHAAGAAAGGIVLQDVRLDADGAPLLLAAGAAVEVVAPTPAWRDASEAVARDAASWRDAADAVLAAAGAAVPEGVERALAARDLAAAGEALLEAWPALPLALDPPRREAQGPLRAPVRRRERPEGAGALWAPFGALLDRLAGALPAGGAGAAAAVLRAVRSVRPRFWLAAGGGAVALALAGGLAAAAEAPGAAAPAPLSAEAASDVLQPEAGAAPSTTATAQAAPAGPDADPATATAALLAEREACLDADDAACLAALHDPASPLLGAAEPWRMPADGTAEPVQRLGEAWLVRIASERLGPAGRLVGLRRQTSKAPDSRRALTWPR